MSRGRAGVVPLLLTALLGASPEAGAAQALRGRLLDDVSAAPVGAAVLELLDEEGERVDAFMTRDDGTYDLRAPGAGPYRVRVQRLGYRSLVLGPFDVPAAGAAVHDLRVAPAPVQLRGITAEGSKRCVVNPETGERTAVLWAEARKVLAGAALVQDRELVRYEAVRFRRRLDPERAFLYDEALEVGLLTRPFHAPPARELVDRGFVRADGDGTVYYAPDPAVALSSAFLDSHCFHIASRRGPEGRFVGLSFEPLEARRLPDVAGTLWLREEDAALASLEFEYRGLARDAWERVAGGRAEFERLDNGLWIIRRWTLRMPMVEERSRFLGLGRSLEVVGVSEEGGEILTAYRPDGRILSREPPGRLTGVARDSVRDRPLAGAVVHLSGTLRTAETDSAGSFRFFDLPRGEYVVTLRHPILDTLGLHTPVTVVRVPSVEVVRLAVPSPETARALACPGLSRRSRPGVLVGRVLDGDGEGIGGARVGIDFVDGARRVRADGETDADGVYRFCGVALRVPVRVSAEAEGWEPATGDVRVPEHGFARMDLHPARGSRPDSRRPFPPDPVAARGGPDSPRTPNDTTTERSMASEHVTAWLEERKPAARVIYQGVNEDDIHVWDMEFDGTDHDFRLGIPDVVIQDEGLLAERLMELETQGWIDQAGEKDIWVLVGRGEVAEGPSWFG